VNRRQTISPSRWFVLDVENAGDIRKMLRDLPRETGVFVINARGQTALRQLRTLAGGRNLSVAIEHPRSATRVHGMKELRRALLYRAGLVFLSPVHSTASHPEWRPIPRMRAATMARLGGRNILALGGMDERRFERVRPFGFVGWAGITAWKRGKIRT
jgi:thiamine-phosphate pyrophosphorylase